MEPPKNLSEFRDQLASMPYADVMRAADNDAMAELYKHTKAVLGAPRGQVLAYAKELLDLTYQDTSISDSKFVGIVCGLFGSLAALSSMKQEPDL